MTSLSAMFSHPTLPVCCSIIQEVQGVRHVMLAGSRPQNTMERRALNVRFPPDQSPLQDRRRARVAGKGCLASEWWGAACTQNTLPETTTKWLRMEAEYPFEKVVELECIYFCNICTIVNILSKGIMLQVRSSKLDLLDAYTCNAKIH